MAATTTQIHPYMFPGEKLILFGANSCQYFHTGSVTAFPSSLNGTTFGPFRTLTTAGEVFQVPVDNFGSRLAGIYIADGASSDTYPVVAVRYPRRESTMYSSSLNPGQSVAWMQKTNSTAAIGMGIVGGQSSVADTGWKLLTTTAAPMGGTSTRAFAYLFGPLDTAKYGIVTASSGDQQDKYQPYFEFQFGVTTAKPEGATSTSVGPGSGIHWSTFSTTMLITNYGSTTCNPLVAFFEMP